MNKLYTAVSVHQYAQILRTKNLVLSVRQDGNYEFEFTEDKNYWIEQIKSQEDLDMVEGYKYALLIEFEAAPKVINELIQGDSGRFSSKIVNYYKELNKTLTVPELKDGESNVLCIEDIYESKETSDGISQKWVLKTDSESSEFWKIFLSGINKISCLGGIPGAMEAVKKVYSW